VASPPPPLLPRRLLASSAVNPALYIGKDEGPGRRTGLNVFQTTSPDFAGARTGPVGTGDPGCSHLALRKQQVPLRDPRFGEGAEQGWHRKDAQTAPRSMRRTTSLDQVYDPRKGNIYVPPSGHVAGVYARSDSERGVHKAPPTEIVRGALAQVQHLPSGAGLPQPARDQLHPNMGDRGIPHLGGATHHLQRSVVALHQRPPACS